ncbi:MAG: CopD family protein [Gammaproteobacteria bacterium]
MTIASTLLWAKALHIIFMVCWFAGLFYLPRLFVNHAMAEDAATRRQLGIMERKLYRFVTPFGWLTAIFGFWLLWVNWPAYRGEGWMHAKLLLVALLAAYHVACGRLVKLFAEDGNRRSHVFYRWFNEFPVLVLFGAVILVVVRPF